MTKISAVSEAVLPGFAPLACDKRFWTVCQVAATLAHQLRDPMRSQSKVWMQIRVYGSSPVWLGNPVDPWRKHSRALLDPAQQSQLDPCPRYFEKHHDTPLISLAICPPPGRKCYSHQCITIRLPFASRYFCRSTRVRGGWNTPYRCLAHGGLSWPHQRNWPMP